MFSLDVVNDSLQQLASYYSSAPARLRGIASSISVRYLRNLAIYTPVVGPLLHFVTHCPP